MAFPISIRGTGKYLPKKVLTNSDLEKLVETSDKWITQRTGIKTRHISADTEMASDMGEYAAREALEDAGLEAKDIDLIVVATTTPDMLYPSTACIIQKKIGAVNAVCFDVSAACSGYIFAQSIAENFMMSGDYNNVLVIGSEKTSKIIDWKNRDTCILFGDGAGAVIFSKNSEQNKCNGEILSTLIKSDGNNYEILSVPGSSVSHDTSPKIEGLKNGCVHMLGREVYKNAVHYMKTISEETLAKAGISSSEVALFIPHQANIRIIDAISSRLGIEKNRVVTNLDKYGNTSGAAIPIALDEALKDGRAKSGDIVLLIAFGAGMTWGGSAIKLP